MAFLHERALDGYPPRAGGILALTSWKRGLPLAREQHSPPGAPRTPLQALVPTEFQGPLALVKYF